MSDEFPDKVYFVDDEMGLASAEVFANQHQGGFKYTEYILKSTADKQAKESYNNGLTEGREYNC